MSRVVRTRLARDPPRGSAELPSRVTTFIEMALDGSRNGTEHVLPLRPHEGAAFKLATCDLFQEDCATELAFSKSSKLKLFRGAPPTVSDVLNALQVHA